MEQVRYRTLQYDLESPQRIGDAPLEFDLCVLERSDGLQTTGLTADRLPFRHGTDGSMLVDVKRVDTSNWPCTIARSAAVLGDHWNLLLVTIEQSIEFSTFGDAGNAKLPKSLTHLHMLSRKRGAEAAEKARIEAMGYVAGDHGDAWFFYK